MGTYEGGDDEIDDDGVEENMVILLRSLMTKLIIKR